MQPIAHKRGPNGTTEQTGSKVLGLNNDGPWGPITTPDQVEKFKQSREPVERTKMPVLAFFWYQEGMVTMTHEYSQL